MNDIYKHQRAYDAKLREQGLTRICRWIPKRDVEKVKKYTDKLLAAYWKEQQG